MVYFSIILIYKAHSLTSAGVVSWFPVSAFLVSFSN